MPESDGTIKFNLPHPAAPQCLSITESFVLAVTSTSVEENLEVPIVVASIDKKFWIPHE